MYLCIRIFFVSQIYYNEQEHFINGFNVEVSNLLILLNSRKIIRLTSVFVEYFK